MGINTEKMRSLRSCLELLLDLEERKRAARKKELTALPEGRLKIIPWGDCQLFQRAGKDGVRGISHNQDMIYKLARKQYLLLLEEEKKIEILWVYQASEEDKEAWGLSRRQRQRASNPGGFRALAEEKMSEVEQLLDKYAKAGLDVLRITCSREQYHWMKAEYRKNTAYPEQLVYETYSGIKVRSKSEQRIGNALEVGWMEGINGGRFTGRGKRYKEYYPDFVILTATGELLIWEHLGRVHEESYRAHNMEKIAAYRQTSFCDDEHLILTFEHDMIKTETLEEIIRRRVLPYF